MPTGEILDSETAAVVLHEAPFVRLRAFLTQDEIFHGDISFEAAVERANEALAIDRLVVDITSAQLRVGRHRVHLDANELAVMATIAHAASLDVPIGNIGVKLEKRPTMGGDAEAFLRVWSRCRGAARLAIIYADTEADVEAHPLPFERACEDYRRTFDYQDHIRVPASHVREKLRALPKELAERVLAKRGLETAFPPSGVGMVLPPGVTI